MSRGFGATPKEPPKRTCCVTIDPVDANYFRIVTLKLGREAPDP